MVRKLIRMSCPGCCALCCQEWCAGCCRRWCPAYCPGCGGECWQGRCRVLSRVQGVCGGESLCRVLWRVLASCAGCCPGIECDVTGPRTFVQVSGLKLQNVCWVSVSPSGCEWHEIQGATIRYHALVHGSFSFYAWKLGSQLPSLMCAWCTKIMCDFRQPWLDGPSWIKTADLKFCSFW